MNNDTLLQIPLIKEKYGPSFLFSIVLHGILILLIIFAGSLLPPRVIAIGPSGLGGGNDGEIPSVGVVSDLSGGKGMIKSGVNPAAPARNVEPQVEKAHAIPIGPSNRSKPAPPAKTEYPDTNKIPLLDQRGTGGIAGSRGGSGGGQGGGTGISIGSGSGGIGDSWYGRMVEARISKNWSHPEGISIDIVVSFYVAADGEIYEIKCEKSSGNEQLDMTAKGAISASNRLSPPPIEYRGRPIQFVARFIHSPNR
jgi:TonB family protein